MSDGIRRVNVPVNQAFQGEIQNPSEKTANEISTKIQERVQIKQSLRDVVEASRNSDNSEFSSLLEKSADLKETREGPKTDVDAAKLLNQQLMTARLTSGHPTESARKGDQEKTYKANEMMSQAEEHANLLKGMQAASNTVVTVVGIVNSVVNTSGISREDLKLLQINETAAKTVSAVDPKTRKRP